MNFQSNYRGQTDAWNLFYFRAKPIIYKLYGGNSQASLEKIERAFLKVSIENPDINPAHYDSLMTRVIDLLEMNSSFSMDKPAEYLMADYYNPN